MKRVNLYHAIASGVLAFAGVSAAAQLTWSGADLDSAQIDVVKMLDEKGVTLRDMSGSTTEAINVLRDKYGVPVSFISAADEKPKTVEFRNEEVTLRKALDEFVQAREAYTHSLVGDRLVVHPRSGPFKKVIGEIDIINRPRLEAIGIFIEHLKRTHAEFGNLIRPGIRGDPRAPLYADRVSLPEEGTVLEHFAGLLGDNPNVIFSIVDGPRSGTRLFVLWKLNTREAKPPANKSD